MHRIRVVRSHYDQTGPYVGQVGEVIGHWGADNSQDGRIGYMVQFPDGVVIGVAEDEVEDVPSEGQPSGTALG
jgi:hypothetical protein